MNEYKIKEYIRKSEEITKEACKSKESSIALLQRGGFLDKNGNLKPEYGGGVNLKIKRYNYFFTGDEHYSHRAIIDYCKRPFKNIRDMNEEISKRHNEVVPDDENSMTIHVGDTTLSSDIKEIRKIIDRLHGQHIFLDGSHDRWLKSTNYKRFQIWEKLINGQLIVCCHYAMLVWPRSHYNSWLLYGHSHGGLNSIVNGKSYDVGVDNNNFYPVSFNKIIEIMKNKPDNFNYIKRE